MAALTKRDLLHCSVKRGAARVAAPQDAAAYFFAWSEAGFANGESFAEAGLAKGDESLDGLASGDSCAGSFAARAEPCLASALASGEVRAGSFGVVVCASAGRASPTPAAKAAAVKIDFMVFLHFCGW
jgi:hypothetical protein